MLEVSGGFVLKCSNCGTQKEYGAEILSPAKIIILEEKPLGLLLEYSFRARLKCSCGQEQSVLFRSLEYPESLHIEGSERMEAEGCICLEPPDVDGESIF